MRLPHRAPFLSSPHIPARICSFQYHPDRPLIKRSLKMNATQTVLDWIAAHPYQTAFQVVNGIIICTPAAATVPVLAALGLGTIGPISGKAVSGHDFITTFKTDRTNANM